MPNRTRLHFTGSDVPHDTPDCTYEIEEGSEVIVAEPIHDERGRFKLGVQLSRALIKPAFTQEHFDLLLEALKAVDNELPQALNSIAAHDTRAVAVISHLAKAADKTIRNTPGNRKPIMAVIHRGYSVEDIKAVIDMKCNQWIGTVAEKNLRISTIFRPNNFDRYHADLLVARGIAKNEPDEFKDMF